MVIIMRIISTKVHNNLELSRLMRFSLPKCNLYRERPIQMSNLKLKPSIQDFMMNCLHVTESCGRDLIRTLPLKFYYCLCVHMCILFNNVYRLLYGCFASMHVCASSVCLVPQRPEETVKCLELESQIVMSHTMLVLETEHKYSASTTTCCEHWPCLQLRTLLLNSAIIHSFDLISIV